MKLTEEFRVKKPSLVALLLGLVPFLGICFSVFAWDRVDPIVFGLPFNLFWLLAWTILTPLFLWGAYRLEASGSSEPSEPSSERHREPPR